jgi:hypothetical protein
MTKDIFDSMRIQELLTEAGKRHNLISDKEKAALHFLAEIVAPLIPNFLLTSTDNVIEELRSFVEVGTISLFLHSIDPRSVRLELALSTEKLQELTLIATSQQANTYIHALKRFFVDYSNKLSDINS